ncbi:TolC family outer membrane protein [Acidimangrovimonas pyrenivorans]|uniref:TolC family outer membrane protein n=1 Tax=Acidimangrovimonas pyrenivorans TaxID=2030798 RepID=A0ABV7ACB7_9RHOB
MNAKILGRAGAAALLVMTMAPGAWAETLSDAMISAYRNSHLLEQNRALLRTSDEDVAVAVSGLRPTLGIAATGRAVTTASASTLFNNLYGQLGLQASMTVYDFGRTKAAIAAAKETVLATRQALVNVEQQVLLGAVTAYMNVRNAEETVVLNQGNVRVLNQELKAAQDRFDVGEITRTDVAQAEAALAAARSQLTAARGQLATAREAYKAAVGHYPGRLAAPPRAPATAKSLTDAVAVAQHNHPQILQAKHQVKAADLSVARAKAGIRPTLSATAEYGTDSGGNKGGSATLTLSQPLYAGGQISALYRKAVAAADQARAGLLQTGVSVTQGVGNAWSQLQVARASITAYNQQIRAAQTAYDGVKEEAKLGSRTTLDVLNAEQSLLNAKASRITAGTNEYIAVYTLLSSMGLLTADHLKLGIPTYDPAAYYNAVKNAPATSVQGKRLDKLLKSIGKE